MYKNYVHKGVVRLLVPVLLGRMPTQYARKDDGATIVCRRNVDQVGSTSKMNVEGERRPKNLNTRNIWNGLIYKNRSSDRRQMFCPYVSIISLSSSPPGSPLTHLPLTRIRPETVPKQTRKTTRICPNVSRSTFYPHPYAIT